MKWSQQVEQESLILRLRENKDKDRMFLEDDESDWRSVMWWANKCSFVKARNCNEKLNPEIEDGQVTHSMLSLAVKEVFSEDTYETCTYLHDIDFIDNVQRVLRLTRLLAFSLNAYDKRSLEEQQK